MKRKAVNIVLCLASIASIVSCVVLSKIGNDTGMIVSSIVYAISFVSYVISKEAE